MVMDEIVSSIPNASPVADAIKIHGRTERDHDLTLVHVLDKCQSAGLHLNLEKIQIKKQSVKFYGNMITTDGLQSDKTTIDAIVKLVPPTNKQELPSLVGMVTYIARFIPNTSALLEPFRALLKDNVHYTWGPEHEHAFKYIKQAIVRPCNIQYFNQKTDTKI